MQPPSVSRASVGEQFFCAPTGGETVGADHDGYFEFARDEQRLVAEVEGAAGGVDEADGAVLASVAATKNIKSRAVLLQQASEEHHERSLAGAARANAADA